MIQGQTKFERIPFSVSFYTLFLIVLTCPSFPFFHFSIAAIFLSFPLFQNLYCSNFPFSSFSPFFPFFHLFHSSICFILPFASFFHCFHCSHCFRYSHFLHSFSHFCHFPNFPYFRTPLFFVECIQYILWKVVHAE